MAKGGVAVAAPVGMGGGIVGMLFCGIVGASAGGKGGGLGVGLWRGLLRHVGERGRVGVGGVMVIGLELVADGRVDGRLALLCVCD